MRTETNPTDNQKEWKPFEKVERPSPVTRDEWQKSPDAPGVEINWRTGKHRTNLPTPNTWVDDLAMQSRDAPRRATLTLSDAEMENLFYTILRNAEGADLPNTR